MPGTPFSSCALKVSIPPSGGLLFVQSLFCERIGRTPVVTHQRPGRGSRRGQEGDHASPRGGPRRVLPSAELERVPFDSLGGQFEPLAPVHRAQVRDTGCAELVGQEAFR